MSLISLSGIIDGQDIEDNFAGIANGSLMHYFGEWTDYTPVWTTTGTAPSLGNGTLTGKYIKIGRLVIGQIKFVAGSSTTYGTGAWLFTLPFNNSTVYYDDEHHPVGSAYIEDLSTVGYDGFVRILSNYQNRIHIHSLNATLTYVADGGISGTVPFSWGNGDFLTAWFMYESEE